MGNDFERIDHQQILHPRYPNRLVIRIPADFPEYHVLRVVDDLMWEIGWLRREIERVIAVSE